jgi:hypothetical protein
VQQLEIVNGKVRIKVYGVCSGFYGEAVFATPEEARQALEDAKWLT